MNKGVIIFSLILVMSVVISACTTPAHPPVVITAPSNSGSDSRINELEAKVRELEAENQQLLAENQGLTSDLTKIKNIVDSAGYIEALSDLTSVQSNTNKLAIFINSVPDPPPLPLEITVSQINKAINVARDLRKIMIDLPDLPPPGWPPFLPFPQELVDLDNMRHTFIDMTEWMENLQDLPEFLATAESLKELKSRIEAYLLDIDNTASEAKTILEELRKATIYHEVKS